MAEVISGGCIRLYPLTHATPGPQWHIDSGHKTIGLFDTRTPPEIDSKGFLVIRLVDEFGVPNSLPVVRASAGPDETLTQKGYSAGPSNGGKILRFGFRLEGFGPVDMNDPVQYKAMAGIYNNLWPTALHWRE